jgi:C-terminal processing protease CtpA/Prc
VINGRRLPSGLGLIRIPTFSSDTGHDLTAEFDAALDGLMDAPGIILDLRGNGGGSSFISDRIGGRFLSQPFTYGCETYRRRLPWHAWQLRWTYRIKPRQPVYTGPVILLIDTTNMSTAELFITALVDSGRAQTVGRQTAGASGNPVMFRLPGGGLARFSTGEFRRRDGTPIEGVGITPTIPIAYTVAAFRQGDDPDLAAAERLLLDGENNPVTQQTTKIRRMADEKPSTLILSGYSCTFERRRHCRHEGFRATRYCVGTGLHAHAGHRRSHHPVVFLRT